MVEQLARSQNTHRGSHRLDLGAKTLQRAHSCFGDAGHVSRVGEDRHDVGITPAGECVDRIDRHVADLARRHRHDPRKAQRVTRVEAETQVGDEVFDLAPLPETDAAHQAVWDAPPRQHVLERAGLGVRPVEDREIGVAAFLGLAQALDLVGDELRLLDLVVRLHRHDFFAARALGPQPLLRAFRVAPDDAVGGVEDRLARAVVLLQVNDMCVRIVLAKVEDVAHVRAAKAVNRLIVIPDHRHVAMLLGQQVDEDVLRAVGVLVLVDQDMAEAVAPLGEGLRVRAEQLDQLHDQVVEVQPTGAAQYLLVGLVHPARHLVGVAPVGIVLRPLELVLGLRDRIAQCTDWIALRIEAELVEDALQRRPGVVLVEDHKA